MAISTASAYNTAKKIFIYELTKSAQACLKDELYTGSNTSQVYTLVRWKVFIRQCTSNWCPFNSTSGEYEV